MRKTISIIVILCFAMTCILWFPISTAALETLECVESGAGTIYYNELSDGTVEIAGYSGYDSDLTIQSTINGKTVSGVADFAFYNSSIERITFRSGIKRIGDFAFSNCNSLEEVSVISPSVKYVGDWAFGLCKNLKECQNVMTDAEYIGAGAFRSCSSLTKIWLDHDLKELGSQAFCGCVGVKQVLVGKLNSIYEDRDSNAIIEKTTNKLIYGCSTTVIPNSVTEIDDYAFYYNDSLTKIRIPDSVTSIGEEAFCGCSNLSSVEIPDSVISVGEYAFLFSEWYNMQPEGIVYAGKVAYGMKGRSPSELVIANGTLGIADGAFKLHTELQSITIPDSVIKIGQEAFKCTSLASVTIPKSVTIIGENAFGYEYDENYNDKKVQNYTVYGYEGTEAERYANVNGFSFVAIEDEPEVMLGDVDGDGVVSVLDATRIQKFKASIITEDDIDLAAADVDNDKVVSVMDATRIQKYKAKLMNLDGSTPYIG